MPSSIPSHRFLLDENVRIELYKLLKQNGIDVKLVPKSATDKEVASISKREQRIIVTSDGDFAKYDQNEVFAVVWLRIPQNDLKTQLSSFKKLLGSLEDFSKKLVLLKGDSWETFELGNWE